MTRTLALALCTGLTLAAPTAALAADKGDPKGNNGTVKIGAVPLDKAPHANQPHVGCSFSLRFFGFDADQTADITFTGQAPTKTGTLLTQKAVPISDDAAGGGKDADAVLTYTVDQLGLRGTTPAKQGWHVKVAVDVLEAPGGAKQKVFWLQCPEAAGTTTPPTTGEAAPTSGGTETKTTETKTTETTTTETTTTPGAGTTTTTSTGSGTTTSAVEAPTGSGVLSETATAPTYGSGVLSESATAPAVTAAPSGGGVGRGLLPFTGDNTANLVWGGLAALGLGGGLTFAARRRHA